MEKRFKLGVVYYMDSRVVLELLGEVEIGLDCTKQSHR